jgi:hypothetical protein
LARGLCCLSNGLSNIADPFDKRVLPMSKITLGVHGFHPALRGLLLNFLKFIVALYFKDQVSFAPVVQEDNKVGQVVVRPPVVQVGDGKPEIGVFHERLDRRVSVDQVGGRLFPLTRVGHDIVDVTTRHRADFPTRPEVNFRGAARPTVLFV